MITLSEYCPLLTKIKGDFKTRHQTELSFLLGEMLKGLRKSSDDFIKSVQVYKALYGQDEHVNQLVSNYVDQIILPPVSKPSSNLNYTSKPLNENRKSKIRKTRHERRRLYRRYCTIY